MKRDFIDIAVLAQAEMHRRSSVAQLNYRSQIAKHIWERLQSTWWCLDESLRFGEGE